MQQLLDVDTPNLRAAFGQRPYAVRHNLRDDLLLTPASIAELADRLPAGSVEHNHGNLPAIVPGGEVTREDMTPGEIARGIESNGCWMVLKNVEQVPEYARLLNAALDELDGYVSDLEGGMTQREGFIFLSAPGSITPSHTDPEHNLLLQVRGNKLIEVGSFPDPETRQEVLEGQVFGHRNLDWMPVDPSAFRLEAGDGVYVPVHAPHWVRNGEQVSVSLSITFRTAVAKREENVVAFNARLRRLGLRPRPPGSHAHVDSAKSGAMRALHSLKTRVAA